MTLQLKALFLSDSEASSESSYSTKPIPVIVVSSLTEPLASRMEEDDQ